MTFLGNSTHPSVDAAVSVADLNQQTAVLADGRSTVGIGQRDRRRRMRVRAWALGALVATVAAALAGCGSSSTPTSSSAASSSSSASASPSSSSSAGSSAAKTTSSTKATSSPTSYPAGKEQICQARDQLKTSITALTDQGLLTDGTTAIKASVDQVQTDFDAVKAAAKEDYHAQVTDMQDALQQLQTAVGNLGNGNTADNLLAVGKAIAATGTAAEDLFTQLKTACGS